LAEKLKIHSRTLNDLKREEYSISLDCLKKICKMAALAMPDDVEIRDPFWYSIKGARKGGLAMIKKYEGIVGDPKYRKMKWYQWWEKIGKHRKNMVVGMTKDVTLPLLSADLAEFTGVMLGDGGIPKSQVIISTNSKDDREYGYFVRDLIDLSLNKICYENYRF